MEERGTDQSQNLSSTSSSPTPSYSFPTPTSTSTSTSPSSPTSSPTSSSNENQVSLERNQQPNVPQSSFIDQIAEYRIIQQQKRQGDSTTTEETPKPLDQRRVDNEAVPKHQVDETPSHTHFPPPASTSSASLPASTTSSTQPSSFPSSDSSPSVSSTTTTTNPSPAVTTDSSSSETTDSSSSITTDSSPSVTTTDSSTTSESESSSGSSSGSENLYECNICLEPSREPVITLCGHLFCWGCIYRWLEQQGGVNRCPVCHSGISQEKLIPIYGRDTPNVDPRQSAQTPQIPQRPRGQRSDPPPQMPMGPFPHFIAPPPTQTIVEQQQAAILSKLLFSLGTFVILCLLFLLKFIVIL